MVPTELGSSSLNIRIHAAGLDGSGEGMQSLFPFAEVSMLFFLI
jgi:hypothetical protein